MPLGAVLVALAVPALIAAVLAAVHHAEVVAHRVGEPFGTLVLALAVTVIEVALIVSMMLAGGADKAALPRDTIFAAVMIICNGVVGLCLLVGGLRHHEQSFRIEGANSALAALIALATLSLVLPTFTTSAPGPHLHRRRSSPSRRSRRSRCGRVFVFVQTVRHRDYFLPPGSAGDEAAHAPPPTRRRGLGELRLLLVSLVAVVGLAKVLSPTIERGGRGGRRAAGGHRHRDRAARAAARDLGRGARGARRPPADQPQPRARLGAGQHRPDDPGGRARLGRARHAARARPRRRRTWCCWR